MQEELSSLQAAIAELLPGAPLTWRDVPETGGLRGLFLEEQAALRPLPAERADAVMLAPPYWALLWPSGHLLCRLFRMCPALAEGRTVLDFGSGCGLVACAAAKAGASRVWAVDIDPLARKASRLNALANGVPIDVRQGSPGDRVGLLLLADFLYDRDHLPLFDRLQVKADEVLIADSRLRRLEASGFHLLGDCEGIAVPDLDPHREFGKLRLWYRGNRLEHWEQASLSIPVARRLPEC